MIRTRFILFLLAAFLGWLPCARASLPALRDRLVSAHVQETRETESTAWELVDVQPFGHADDGTPLTLFVFVELPDPFDMFSPVSTRAGPKTHTRVLYVVQPLLGLDIMPLTEVGEWLMNRELDTVATKPSIEEITSRLIGVEEFRSLESPVDPQRVVYLGDDGYTQWVRGIVNLPAVYAMNREYLGGHWYAIDATFNPMSTYLLASYELRTGFGIRAHNHNMELTEDDRFGNWVQIIGSSAQATGYGVGAAFASRRFLPQPSGQQPGVGVLKIESVEAPRALPVLPDGYHYRSIGTNTYVVRNPGQAGNLPQLHLRDGVLRTGPRPRASLARNTAERAAFIRSQATNPNTPKWMKPWLERGQVPPGFEVHHRVALFDGGLDMANNMVLQGFDLHKITHRFYRPGGRIPSISPPPPRGY